MVACFELFAISKRLGEIRNVPDKPFGGMNIILAGDLAQLPPVTQGSALYQQGTIKKLQNYNMSIRDQENTIGLFDLAPNYHSCHFEAKHASTITIK